MDSLELKKIISVLNELGNRKPVAGYSSEPYKKKTPKRKYSVLRGRVIYVCPVYFKRVHQFKERCSECGQALEWDIGVVK